MSNVKLGVNIDHIATLRQARGTRYPDPVQAALIAQTAGADSITMHLREDRRHIIDRDLYMVKEVLEIPLNMEMAVTEEMLTIAENLKPEYCCLVPEKREERTTEGGLDIVSQFDKVAAAVERLTKSSVIVSLFIAPDLDQVRAAYKMRAAVIELTTGQYAEAKSREEQVVELEKVKQASKLAHKYGLIVNAGHGLHYQNTQAIAAIPEMHELNIGHAIVSRAVLTGLSEAIKDMKILMK